MKLSNEEILERIEELENVYDWEEITNFIFSLDLTPEQMELLSDHENEWVRRGLAQNHNLNEKVMVKLSSDKDANVKQGLARNFEITEKTMIKLSRDEGYIRYWLTTNPNLTNKVIIMLLCDEDMSVGREVFRQFRNLNSLKSEDLENAYDLINNSKYISREYFEKTFNYIIDRFPELSKLAKMFKTIILKGKQDLK